ncbi:MAG: hypothetical protein IPN32_22185 [Deltaproteobacteria bacterium]|nr:hypothetical protein [Deltaproteobacteria bacterium]
MTATPATASPSPSTTRPSMRGPPWAAAVSAAGTVHALDVIATIASDTHANAPWKTSRPTEHLDRDERCMAAADGGFAPRHSPRMASGPPIGRKMQWML